MKIIELGSVINLEGKAGNLNKLFYDFNIARGFIIPSDVFKYFLISNNINLNNDFETIRKDILNGEFNGSDDLIKYLKMNKYDNVIVRSSASLEDGNNFSFSGQFDSFLNININDIIENIKKCWASIFTENVWTYLEEKQIKVKDVSFDVLIQEMIDSDIGGIGYSINPINKRDEFLIEACEGKCSNLVNGLVIPHTYYIKNNIISDDLLSHENLIEVQNNINKLLNIFKKDIEIEFCFKDNLFYLLQVRPITSVGFSITNYINEEFWCCFKNNNRSLFNRSLWILGATKYKHKRIHNLPTEDITIFYPNNLKQVRGFNGSQPPLDNITVNSHNEEDINNYIDEYYNIDIYIRKLSNVIEKNIIDDDYKQFLNNLRIIIKQNALINSYEYLIGSLGQSLHDTLKETTLKNIENWRNNEQNNNFSIYNKILDYVLKHFKINMELRRFKLYLHANELLKLCEGKLTVKTLISRINLREKNGFVLLNIQQKKYTNKVITNKKQIEMIKNRIENLQDEKLQDNKNLNGIKGISTFKNGKVITGECVVIKNNLTNIGNLNLDNKILVCPVTTSKDITYLKNIKALIVDNGGILCHSAIFSREFKIPCLMGCEIATQFFKTGDIIKYSLDDDFATVI